MTDCEKRLVRLWVAEDGEPVEEVARHLRRNRSSTWDLLADEFDGPPGGGGPCEHLTSGYPRRTLTKRVGVAPCAGP